MGSVQTGLSMVRNNVSCYAEWNVKPDFVDLKMKMKHTFVLAAVIALSGGYEQILNYVVSIDFIFFGLVGAALYRKSRPDHPLTPLFFVAACWITVLATIVKSPGTSFIGLGILAAGVPVYSLWKRQKA